jgi:hypothetical protein
MKTVSICASIAAGCLLLSSCSLASSSSSSSSSSSGAASSGSSSASASPAGSQPKRPAERPPLSVEKTQVAVDKVLDWTRKGGTATVLGIQEMPNENAARADIRFDNFQYNADMYGTPADKNKKAPPEPDIRDPKYYEKMYQNRVGQMQVKRFSGRGVGILKHYNDGRWVLTEVQFDFVGLSRNIELN